MMSKIMILAKAMNLISNHQKLSLLWQAATIIGPTKYKILFDHYGLEKSDQKMMDSRKLTLAVSTMQRRREKILAEFQQIIEFLFQKSFDYYSIQ